MNLRNQFWILRQNYGEITNQQDMKNLIKRQKFVTCPWGGWGTHRQNVIDNIYNENVCDESDRSSNGQDRKFVEEMNIGDIVLIPFSKINCYIIAKITSNVDYAIDTGLYWKKVSKQIYIGDNDGLPFRPVGRHIEIISEDFIPNKSLGQWSLSKMNKELETRLNNFLINKMNEGLTHCGICLEELKKSDENYENDKNNENIYKTICGHLFHHNCIHKSMCKSNNCPYCRKELQTPSANCIYGVINSAMKEGDYAEMICDYKMLETDIADEDCYFTESYDTLYFIMYIFGGNTFVSINYDRLLLSVYSYHNNIRFYPKKILKDYKNIAEIYDRWYDFEQYYELDLDTQHIERYISDNKRKPNSVLLMNKVIEWNYYEEEYEKMFLQENSMEISNSLNCVE
jgi:hypothetical protein